MADPPFDPFAELQLSPDAEPELIKAAFKALAKKYHPDRFSDPVEKAEAERKMARINEAQRLIQSGEYRPPEPQFSDPAPPPAPPSPPPRPASPPKKPPRKNQISLPGLFVAGLAFCCLLVLPGLWPGNHVEKALQYEEKGEYLLSLEELNEAVRKDPHNRELYGHRARIWDKLGKPDRAEVDRKNAETPTLTIPTATPSPAEVAPSPDANSSG